MLTTPSDNFKIKQYSETPLEDFLKEMGETREPFTNPDPKTELPSPETPGGSSAEPDKVIPPLTESAPVVVIDPKEVKDKRDFTAKMLGKYTDQAMAFLCALIADSDDLDEYKASPDDKKDLVECYFEMCVGYGWVSMPPWLNLVFCIGVTYGPKGYEAFKDRKINKEIARKAIQADAERAIAEQKLLDIQAENKRLKDDASAKKTPETKNPNPDGNESTAK